MLVEHSYAFAGLVVIGTLVRIIEGPAVIRNFERKEILITASSCIGLGLAVFGLLGLYYSL